MKLRKIIIYCILSFCRLFLIFKKINPKQITFVSLEHDRLVNDFALINRQLEKQNCYDIRYELVHFEKTIMGNFKYLIATIRQFFTINTSALVILDYNNYVVSKFKRKGVKVLQLWHATGAIKQFGNAVNRDYKIANYDYVISNSEFFIKPYAEAFAVKPEQVKVTGIPRTDRLFNKHVIARDRKQLFEQYPQIVGKKIVVYAPTFRGRLMKGFKDNYMNLDLLQEALDDSYCLVYKLHPLLEHRVIASNPKTICMNSISIRKLFSITDILISDYSAIILDFSVFLKKMIFYVPDLQEYREETGLFLDYEKEMPGAICFNEQQVIDEIHNDCIESDRIRQFRDTCFAYLDGKSLSRVMLLIDEIMKE